jgi:hypothetical protein
MWVCPSTGSGAIAFILMWLSIEYKLTAQACPSKSAEIGLRSSPRLPDQVKDESPCHLPLHTRWSFLTDKALGAWNLLAPSASCLHCIELKPSRSFSFEAFLTSAVVWRWTVSFTPYPLYPFPPVLIGGSWVGPRTGRKDLEIRKCCFHQDLKSDFSAVQPVANDNIDWANPAVVV